MSLRPKTKRKPPHPRSGTTLDKVMIDFTQRNAVSRKVLKEMKSIMKNTDWNHGKMKYGTPTLEFFTNGRERGYTMIVGNRAVHWAESRGADDIVVYFSKGTFNRSAYNDREFFRPNLSKEAAEYMLEYLYGGAI